MTEDPDTGMDRPRDDAARSRGPRGKTGRTERSRSRMIWRLVVGVLGLSGMTAAAIANKEGYCLTTGERLSLEQARDLAIARLIADQRSVEDKTKMYSKNTPGSWSVFGEKGSRLFWRNSKFFHTKEDFESRQELTDAERLGCAEHQSFRNPSASSLFRMLGNERTVVTLCWIEYPFVEGETAPRREILVSDYSISNCGSIALPEYGVREPRTRM